MDEKTSKLIEERARELAAQAPPLTGAQRDKLAILLRPAVEAAKTARKKKT